ncbi:hypothetical protein BARC2635_0014 [Bacteroides phage Barc2635]|nr:hypothetical protein BARC2635_0014 [Bacteroides phage Barc2635]
MEKVRLTKKQKGDKFVYAVVDEKNNVISTRTSKRDYVACTVNGEFYFGRIDLIGKGKHGECISYYTNIINDPEKEYIKFINGFVPSYRIEMMKYNPKNEWIDRLLKCAKETLPLLNTIAYLSK